MSSSRPGPFGFRAGLLARQARLALVIAAAATQLSSCFLLSGYTPEQICETIIRARCHFALSCCTAAERSAFLPGTDVYRSESECIDDNLRNAPACVEALEVRDAVADGRFTYDEALAQKCNQPLVDALNSCDADVVLGDDLKVPHDCPVGTLAYGEGTVKEGDGCFEGFECKAAGSLCLQNTLKPDDDKLLRTAAGTCVSPAKEGGDCSADGSDGLCEPGTVCAPTSSGDLVCSKVEKVDDGQPCFSGDECSSGFCEPGAFVCAKPPPIVVEACNGLDGDDSTEF